MISLIMMSLSLPASQPSMPPVGMLEKCVLGLIFILTAAGAFDPIDQYLNPVYGLNTQQALTAPPQSYGISSNEHRLSLLVLLAYSCVYGRGLLSQICLIIPPLCLLAWIFASSLWSVDPTNSFHRCMHAAGFVFLATYLMHRFRWHELINFMAQNFFIIFVLSVGMVIFLPQFGYSHLNGYQDAWAGAFTHKNKLGATALFGIITAGYALAMGYSNRSFALVALCGQLLLLIMSRSATSMIAFGMCIVALLVFLIVSSRRSPLVRFMAFILLLAGTLAVGIYLLSASSLNEAVNRSATMTGRTQIWYYVLKIIAERPWTGFGYGFWGAMSPEKIKLWQAMNWPAPHAHNEWLDITLQAGLVGLVLELWCFAIASFRALRCSLHDSAGLYCGLILLALMARGMTETVLSDPSISGWGWLVIAYLKLAQLSREKASVPAPQPIPA
jgi:O-antigen ligase